MNESEGLVPTANVSTNIVELGKKMTDANVASIKVNFSGSGDSGEIDSLELFDINESVVNHDIDEDDIISLFDEVTYKHIPGWENNEGASGYIQFSITREGAFEISADVDGYTLESSEPEYSKVKFSTPDNDEHPMTETELQLIKDGGVLRCSYYGSGDSGGVESIEIVDIKDKNVSIHNYENINVLSQIDNKTISDIATELLCDEYRSFEVNEGGTGYIFMNMATGEAVIEHQNFYEDAFDYLSGDLLITAAGAFPIPEDSSVKISI